MAIIIGINYMKNIFWNVLICCKIITIHGNLPSLSQTLEGWCYHENLLVNLNLFNCCFNLKAQFFIFKCVLERNKMLLTLSKLDHFRNRWIYWTLANTNKVFDKLFFSITLNMFYALDQDGK